MGRSGRKNVSSSEPRHWTETHPDRNMWSPGRLAVARTQTREEYEALYGRSQEALRKIPAFLGDGVEIDLHSRVEDIIPGEKFYWVDKEGQVNFIGGKNHLHLGARKTERISAYRISAYNGRVSALSHDGRLLFYDQQSSRGSSFDANIPPWGSVQTVQSGALLYDGVNVELQRFYTASPESLPELKNQAVRVFVPGRSGAFIVSSSTHGSHKDSRILFVDSQTGHVESVDIAGLHFITASDVSVSCSDDKIFFACQIEIDGKKDISLYEITRGEHSSLRRLRKLERVPQDITALGDQVMLLYSDNSYELQDDQLLLEQGQLPRHEEIILEEGGVLFLHRDRSRVTLFKPRGTF